MTDDQIDAHLDAILRASGTALKHFTLAKPKNDMRAALRAALAAPEAAEPVAITDAMVEAYLNAQAAYCQKCDRDIRVPFTPVLATRAGLEAAFALSGQAGRDAVEADVRDALLVEAEDLLRTAYNAMMKWGLRDHGSDCGLPHEIRMFALDFSDKGRDGPGELQVRGSGRYRAWLDRLSTPTGRAAE